jgi:DNA-directed RNA polymerase specialized sigma24 family protein
MPGDSKPTLSFLTAEAILDAAFERLRPRLLAMVGRRVGSKLAARIDPEGVVQEAYLRARPRWQAMSPKPGDIDVWVYGQVVDRLIELIRGALGPEHDVAREVAWPDGSAAPLAEHLVDSQTGPSTALSRAERREAVRAALEKLDPVDREILGSNPTKVRNVSQRTRDLTNRQEVATIHCPRGWAYPEL